MSKNTYLNSTADIEALESEVIELTDKLKQAIESRAQSGELRDHYGTLCCNLKGLSRVAETLRIELTRRYSFYWGPGDI